MAILFRVTGAAPFPLDMLRSEQCWPVEPEDVKALAGMLAPLPIGKPKPGPTPDLVLPASAAQKPKGGALGAGDPAPVFVAINLRTATPIAPDALQRWDAVGWAFEAV
jgi:hypothetical protein